MPICMLERKTSCWTVLASLVFGGVSCVPMKHMGCVTREIAAPLVVNGKFRKCIHTSFPSVQDQSVNLRTSHQWALILTATLGPQHWLPANRMTADFMCKRNREMSFQGSCLWLSAGEGSLFALRDLRAIFSSSFAVSVRKYQFLFKEDFTFVGIYQQGE